jgi:hypothetical protein
MIYERDYIFKEGEAIRDSKYYNIYVNAYIVYFLVKG